MQYFPSPSRTNSHGFPGNLNGRQIVYQVGESGVWSGECEGIFHIARHPDKSHAERSA
jgi:hypothetical protein